MDRKKLEKEIAKYESWIEQTKFRNPLLFGIANTPNFGKVVHPIYGREDLTPQEQDMIMRVYDRRQIASDWKRIGQDFRKYINS